MERLLTKTDVANWLGCHPEHVMRMARQGRFPKPLKLHPSDRGRVRFVANDVATWIAQRQGESGR